MKYTCDKCGKNFKVDSSEAVRVKRAFESGTKIQDVNCSICLRHTLITADNSPVVFEEE